MPYLDGRAPIVPITNPLGTQTQGYIQCHGQIVSQDPTYHLLPKGNAQYLTPDKRVKWNPPANESITRNTQVTEKEFKQIIGLKILYNFDETIISLNVMPGKRIPDGQRVDEKTFLSSLVREQEHASLIPHVYNSSAQGSKNYIQTHGTERIPKPNQYAQVYSGAEVITNTYAKNGKNNAFTENSDGTTFTPINIKKHSANDSGIRGSTLAGLKARGLIS